MAPTSLLTDKSFWYKLRVDYDQVYSASMSPLRDLVFEFLRGKKSHAESRVGNLELFLERLAKLTDKELRSILFSIYVDFLWAQYKSGPQFLPAKGKTLQTQTGSLLSFMRKEKDVIVEESEGGYRLVWLVKASLVDEGDVSEDRVVGLRLLQAEPTLLSLGENAVEVRGRKENVKRLRAYFTNAGLLEIRPQVEIEPLTSYVDKALEQDNPFFEIVGIRYSETNLPRRSRLALRNPVGIREDILHLGAKDIVIPTAFSDISQIMLRAKESGKIVRLRLRQYDEGFAFEIDDKKLDESERGEIRELLSKVFNLSFDKVYDYKVQFDEKFIFNKMLSGSVPVYQKYHNLLSKPAQSLVDEILDVVETEKLQCVDCGREFVKGATCPQCGSINLRKTTAKFVFANDDKIFSAVLNRCQQLPAASRDGKMHVSKVVTKTMRKRKMVNLALFRTEFAGKQSFSRYYSFYAQPLGGGGIAQTIGEYLLNTILVVYGGAFFRKDMYSKFGVIDLYSFLKLDDNGLQKAIQDAIETSIRLGEERVVQASSEAEARLQRLLRSEESYTPKDFERDIFYIIKRMFPYSWRLGRIAHREADGLAIFGIHNGAYFVAGYDPKLSQKTNGYELDVSEQDKAVFYVLDESANEELRLLTNDRVVNAHLIISNRFNEKRFEGYAEGIRKWFSLTSDNTEPLHVPIVFVPLKQLLGFYSIYVENWINIKGNPAFHRSFFEGLAGLLTTNEPFTVVTDKEVEGFRESILQIRRTLPIESLTL